MSASARLDHASATVWLDLDEAVALEPDESFAHRGLRDAEIGRDAGLDELLAVVERPGDDLVAQLLVDAALELCREDSSRTHGPQRRYIVSRAW